MQRNTKTLVCKEKEECGMGKADGGMIAHRAKAGSRNEECGKRRDKSKWQRTERSDSTLRYPAVRFSALQNLLSGVGPGLNCSTFRIPNSEFFRMLHALCVLSCATRNPYPATRNYHPVLTRAAPCLRLKNPNALNREFEHGSYKMESVQRCGDPSAK